nr:hypothetical protein [Ktedonobacter racemifer]
MRKNVGAEPGEQSFFIGAMEFADLRDRADLRSMGLNGAPLPSLLGKKSRINAHLGCEEAHHFGSRLLSGMQKTAFILKTLEEDGKPQARCPRFVPDRV